MNKKALREEHLLRILRSAGRMSINEVVTTLDVSEATARRMLVELEQRGEVIRNYGGVQIIGAGDSYSFEKVEKVRQAEKQRIGRAAAALVQSDDTIYLDCGTTVFQMALALGKRMADGEFTSLNIITNSLSNIQALSPCPDCRVILVGGEYHFERRDFFGPMTEQYVEPFHFTKSFLGCEGASEQMGFTSNSIDVSSLNTSVIRRSDETIVLMDTSKLGKNTLTRFAAFNQVDVVVTEAAPDGRIGSVMEQEGLRFVIAP